MAVFPPNILWCCKPAGVWLWFFDIPGGTWMGKSTQTISFICCCNMLKFPIIPLNIWSVLKGQKCWWPSSMLLYYQQSKILMHTI